MNLIQLEKILNLAFGLIIATRRNHFVRYDSETDEFFVSDEPKNVHFADPLTRLETYRYEGDKFAALENLQKEIIHDYLFEHEAWLDGEFCEVCEWHKLDMAKFRGQDMCLDCYHVELNKHEAFKGDMQEGRVWRTMKVSKWIITLK